MLHTLLCECHQTLFPLESLASETMPGGSGTETILLPPSLVLYTIHNDVVSHVPKHWKLSVSCWHHIQVITAVPPSIYRFSGILNTIYGQNLTNTDKNRVEEGVASITTNWVFQHGMEKLCTIWKISRISETIRWRLCNTSFISII